MEALGKIVEVRKVGERPWMAVGGELPPSAGYPIQDGMGDLARRTEIDAWRLLRGADQETLVRLGTAICHRRRDHVTGVLQIRRGAALLADPEGEVYLDIGILGIEGEHEIRNRNGVLVAVIGAVER